MPLTLILGPANSAKAGEVLAAYAAAAQRDALLVVPTAADAEHYDRELAAGGTVLGRALTFSGLIAEIADRGQYSAPRLTPLQRERLLRRTVTRLDLTTLGDSARAAGFPAAAGHLFTELGRSRVTPPRFAAALRTWAAGDPARAGYASDLGLLYLTYARELERSGRLDGEQFAWQALDALRAAPQRWGTTPVFLYGFDDLTPIERDTVETLSRIVGAEVTVSLTYEAGHPALIARASVVEDLRQQASRVRDLPSLDEHYAPSARAALHHLERHLFGAAPAPCDPGDAVQLMEAGGERAEAELIAAEVLASLREGVPAEEIVVICRSLSRSGALLERMLHRYGVAAASARTVPLGHTALGRSLLALGRCAFRPTEATGRDLLAYLRAPGIVDSPGRVDELEAHIRRRGLTSAAEARAATAIPLPELDALRAAPDPGAELARQARALVAAPHRRSAARLSPESQLDARAAAAILDALAQLSDLEGPLPGGDLLDLLAGLEVPAAEPAGAGAVLVAEPLAIRARRFRRVFVCGLCEGEFPAAGTPDPFLGEERRRELAVAAGLVLGGEEDALARERYLFYACVSRATERLVLTYRSSDEEGNLVLPSPFVADVAELFVPEWRAQRRRRLLADVVWSPEEAPTVREWELGLAAAGWLRAGPAGARPDAERAGPRAARGHAPAGPAATRVLGERALGHVRHREVVSGGALESFAQCPVKWLVERQLEPEELAPEPEAVARGSFMHDVLERVIGDLGGPVTPGSLPEAERRLDELVAEPPPGLAAGRPPAVRAAILRGIEADLRRYLRHEASDGCDWVPRSLEQRFGFDDEDSLPGLVLGDAGGEHVLVRGMIDRVDVEPGPTGAPRALVRDYKSGANRPERAGARWAGEHQLQVALYLLAVQRLLALEPVGGFYQPLTGRELRARGAYVAGTAVGNCAYGTDALDPDGFDELVAAIERDAVELAMTLRRGELTPCPETCGRDGCRHPGICWA